jgi:hypothetical protein
MKLHWPKIPGRKRRKQPIQRDDEGRSLRQRTVLEFDRGRTPEIAASALGMKLSTAQRYHRAWRKTEKNIALKYEATRNPRRLALTRCQGAIATRGT